MSSVGTSATEGTRVRIADAVQRYYDNQAPTGMIVGVISSDSQGNVTPWIFPQGMTRSGDGSVPDGATLWQLGSITKTFTATVLAAKCHDGTIGLHDQVQPHAPHGVTLPPYSTWNQSIGIRFVDLATHTAGLPLDARGVPVDGGYTVEEMYRYLNLYALAIAPGANWNYSDLGFGLLANILVSMSACSSYEALVDDLKRRGGLHMPDTVITLSEVQKQRRAYGYTVPGKQARWDTPTWPALNGSGALYSTVNDILVWLAYNLGCRDSPLNPLLKIVQSVYLDSGGDKMGLAWQAIPFGASGMTCWSKGGRTNGFTSFIVFSRELKAGVCVFSNSAWIWPQDLATDILGLLA
jgi:serine-type D-Ala-D-Ala carboxypeptidase/endopeptidase